MNIPRIDGGSSPTVNQSLPSEKIEMKDIRSPSDDMSLASANEDSACMGFAKFILEIFVAIWKFTKKHLLICLDVDKEEEIALAKQLQDFYDKTPFSDYGKTLEITTTEQFSEAFNKLNPLLQTGVKERLLQKLKVYFKNESIQQVFQTSPEEGFKQLIEICLKYPFDNLLELSKRTDPIDPELAHLLQIDHEKITDDALLIFAIKGLCFDLEN